MQTLKSVLKKVGKRDGRPVARYLNLMKREILKARSEGYTISQIKHVISDPRISKPAFFKAVSSFGVPEQATAFSFIRGEQALEVSERQETKIVELTGFDRVDQLREKKRSKFIL